MIISNVKYQEDPNYITIFHDTGSTSTPWPAPMDYINDTVQAWLDEGNTIQPWKTDEEFLGTAKYDKSYEIRQDAIDRIEAVNAGYDPDATEERDELKANWVAIEENVKRDWRTDKVHAGGTLTPAEIQSANDAWRWSDWKRATMVEANNKVDEVNNASTIEEVNAVTPNWPPIPS